MNCHHVFPDLRKLEKKYPKELVVVGIHSAKFTNEGKTGQIKKAAIRHGLAHPILNDQKFKIWNRYGVRAWPTLLLIDPEGFAVWAASGEGHYDVLVKQIDKLIRKWDKQINRKVFKWKLEVQKESVLSFPGKIVASADRLFITDTNRHRILITDHSGKVESVIGTGKEGWKDGGYAEAQFAQPQGTLLDGDFLYVADVENHMIRRINLKEKTVKTIAGTGKQGFSRKGGPALKTGLNSPWDLAKKGHRLYIAMAGSHTLWVLDLKTKRVALFSGNGLEELTDGRHAEASFNQPSGLTILNDTLYVADSEISGIRAVDLDPDGKVVTVVGTGLFDFGDVDGVGDKARLQHVLGVHEYKGKIIVADSYNHKIKILDPKTRKIETFLGDGKAGLVDGKTPRFNEPNGIYIWGDKLFIADQNNHAIRVVDMKTKEVTTLKITGLKP